MSTAPARPILSYHGGKWRLAPWIISHFPPHRIYVEPYGGAASVLLRKPRSYAEIYNDLDGDVVNLFRVLRDPIQAARLEELIRLTPFAREEFEESYEPTTSPIERARKLLVRSAMGFSTTALRRSRTGFRANATKSRTHPAMDWAGLPDIIASATERLAGVVVESRPALDVIAAHDGPNTLIYADPPYVHSTRKAVGHGPYRHEMDDDEHASLAGMLIHAQGMVVVSGYRSVLYDALYVGWRRVERETFADRALARTECLWMNRNASRALQDQGLFAGVEAR